MPLHPKYELTDLRASLHLAGSFTIKFWLVTAGASEFENEIGRGVAILHV